MAYEALYRQYRPKTFSEVIGQEHITTILKNQVKSGRPAHAYLFTGSRGTGKTSTARILSRAVNCLSPQDGEPCGVCSACVSMQDTNNVDIVEMDAATNSRVDDARALIEKARFMPMQLKKKVYIIDEVHALSPSAFSALLKTLEEPPAHVLFILATTEPQKLPATIVSRCQRMDFHRLSIGAMTACMKGILAQAGVAIEDEGIAAIARTAEGGMRDALSLADQCIAFCGNNVSTSDVYSMLGSMDSEFLFEMADALIGFESGRALALLDKVMCDGRDLSVFMRDVTAHFRALLLAKLCGACSDLLDCTEDAMRRYLEQAGRCSDVRLLRAEEALLKAQMNARMVEMPRVLFEGALVRIARPEEEEKSLEELSVRLEKLEAKLAGLETLPVPAKPAPVEVRQSAAEKPTPQREAPPKREAPPAQTEAAAPKSSSAWEPETLWKELLKRLYEKDRMLQVIAMAGKAYAVEGNALIVRFDSEPKLRAVQMNDKAALLGGILNELAPGMSLRTVSVREVANLGEQARSLFGKDVEIVD